MMKNIKKRESVQTRETKETKIELSLNLDGTGKSKINTGIGFLDHMLTLFAFHGKIDLEINSVGDLHVDSHHSIEDIGIILGKAIGEALGDKNGIERYGFSYLPMDETLARTVIDFSGRSYLVFNANFKREYLGNLATEDIKEFFIALSSNSKATLHMEILYGENDHHKAEAIFKSFGRAFHLATEITTDIVQSTKGIL